MLGASAPVVPASLAFAFSQADASTLYAARFEGAKSALVFDPATGSPLDTILSGVVRIGRHVDRRLPEAPVRRWVMSLPWELRYRRGYDVSLATTTSST